MITMIRSGDCEHGDGDCNSVKQ